MKWIVLTIAAFVSLHTWLLLSHRKEEDPNLPYEESRERGGHALHEAGWQPFPNAFALPPAERQPSDILAPVTVGKVALDDPSVAEWARLLPNLSQGEQVLAIESRETIASGQPYAARIVWQQPERFRAPQLLFFRRGDVILIVPRAPMRGRDRAVDETIFLIPPDFLKSGGRYEVLLVTERQLNRWTFAVD